MIDQLYELFEKLYGYLKELIASIKKFIGDLGGAFGGGEQETGVETETEA